MSSSITKTEVHSEFFFSIELIQKDLECINCEIESIATTIMHREMHNKDLLPLQTRLLTQLNNHKNQIKDLKDGVPDIHKMIRQRASDKVKETSKKLTKLRKQIQTINHIFTIKDTIVDLQSALDNIENDSTELAIWRLRRSSIVKKLTSHKHMPKTMFEDLIIIYDKIDTVIKRINFFLDNKGLLPLFELRSHLICLDHAHSPIDVNYLKSKLKLCPKSLRHTIYSNIAKALHYRGFFKKNFGKEHLWEDIDTLKQVIDSLPGLYEKMCCFSTLSDSFDA